MSKINFRVLQIESHACNSVSLEQTINTRSQIHIIVGSGHLDKTGKEIFQGDIIRADHGEDNIESPVEFCPTMSAFIVKSANGYSIFLYDITDCLIIGSIYDHGE